MKKYLVTVFILTAIVFTGCSSKETANERKEALKMVKQPIGPNLADVQATVENIKQGVITIVINKVNETGRGIINLYKGKKIETKYNLKKALKKGKSFSFILSKSELTFNKEDLQWTVSDVK